MNQSTPPRLQIGDCVQFLDGYNPEVTGVVIELLHDHLVRVYWHDLGRASTHRDHCLSVVAAAREADAQTTVQVRCHTTPKPPSEE
jgi:hypothetical protein